MKIIQPSEVVEIANRFAEDRVRYLVCGGLAVIAHGYVRLTKDIDLIIDFDGENEQRCVRALTALGFKPRAPVPFMAWTDPAERLRWQEEKDMKAFSVWRSSAGFHHEIDLFLAHPFPFAEALASALWREAAPGGPAVPFVDRARLIAMKRSAGRPNDLVDIAALERLT